MPISEKLRQQVSEDLLSYIDGRIPLDIRGKVRNSYVWEKNSVILFEERPHFREPTIWTKTNVAKFRYVISKDVWLLYCRDRNNKWHLYDLLKPQMDFMLLLVEVENDPTGIFWG